MRRKSTILSVAVIVMISLCLMLTGKVGFDTPAFAADKSKVYEIKLVTSNPSTDPTVQLFYKYAEEIKKLRNILSTMY